MFSKSLQYYVSIVLACTHLGNSAPFQGKKRAEETDKLVFAHLVVSD